VDHGVDPALESRTAGRDYNFNRIFRGAKYDHPTTGYAPEASRSARLPLQQREPRPLLDAIGTIKSRRDEHQQYYKVKVSEIVVEDVIRPKYSSP